MSTQQNVSPLAGKPAPRELLVDAAALLAAYAAIEPQPDQPAQRVSFGTSGHRGSALEASFNEWHVAAITQAICHYRRAQGVDGPLFLGIDTHALSEPAAATALEVLAANGVQAMIAGDSRFTPTPAVSHAILTHNVGRRRRLADGIVVTPSHNPPDSGGIKYNPPGGGPSDSAVSGWIEREANRLLEGRLAEVKRIPHEQALKASTTDRYDYLGRYVESLDRVLDLAVVSAADVRIGIDPLGGAGVDYWGAIAERYRLSLTVVNDAVDPTFGFMTVDWDGRIRMDPSSPHAMQGLITLRDRFDLAGACDTDHDRHGIITPAGLMPPNHYLAVMVDYLFRHRPEWPASARVGKTVVTSGMLDRVAASLGRNVYETPVGFKWFADGLLDGALAFGGEESAGASFSRFDGAAWSTDKDGITAVLLAAEMTARTGQDPGERYRALTRQFGESAYRRIDAPATAEQKARLAGLTPERVTARELAGETVEAVLVQAPGNGKPIGGLKVVAANGWFALRPSGTEDLYKLYAESFAGEDHLERVLTDAQVMVSQVLA